MGMDGESFDIAKKNGTSVRMEAVGGNGMSSSDVVLCTSEEDTPSGGYDEGEYSVCCTVRVVLMWLILFQCHLM